MRGPGQPAPSASLYCSFHLPSDLIASFSFGLYLKLHQPYLLLSPPAGSDCRESPVLAYQSAESVLQSGLARFPQGCPPFLVLGVRHPATPWKAFSSVLSHFLCPGPSASRILTTSCLSRAHTWRLLPPSLRLSLLHHVHFLFPCCASGIPAHRTAAGFSFCLLALWALLLSCSAFSAEPVLEGRELDPRSLCHYQCKATCTQTQPGNAGVLPK